MKKVEIERFDFIHNFKSFNWGYYPWKKLLKKSISTIQDLYLDFKKQALVTEECTYVQYHQKDKQTKPQTIHVPLSCWEYRA